MLCFGVLIDDALGQAREMGKPPVIMWMEMEGYEGLTRWGPSSPEVLLDPRKVSCQRRLELLILHETGHILHGHIEQSLPAFVMENIADAWLVHQVEAMRRDARPCLACFVCRTKG
jgi:hypothetical protein